MLQATKGRKTKAHQKQNKKSIVKIQGYTADNL